MKITLALLCMIIALILFILNACNVPKTLAIAWCFMALAFCLEMAGR
jgi:hypothetical protein